MDAKCLPPCRNSLRYHTNRANYQAAIWRRTMEPNPETPSPNGFGWIQLENGSLDVQWTTIRPAPEHVLELLACSCKKHCKEGICPCMLNKLNCTDACHSFECSNQIDDSDESEVDSSDDEFSGDED